MPWKRWPWPDAGLLPLLIVALRVCWIWPWLQTLTWLMDPGAPVLLPLWAVIALLIGGALTAQAAAGAPASPRRARYVVAALGLVAIFLVLWQPYRSATYSLWDLRWAGSLAYGFVHPAAGNLMELTAFIVAAGLWLRGMQDSDAPSHDEVWRAFVTGFWAWVLLLLVIYLEPAAAPPRLSLWIVLFFATGMAGLALGGLQLARDTRPDRPLRLNRHWLLAGLALIALVIGLGLLLGALVTPEGMAQTFGWVGAIVRWIGVAIGYLLLALVYLLSYLLAPLINLILWLRAQYAPPPATPQGFSLQQLLEQLQQQEPVGIPPAADETLRWLGLLTLLALFALAFALAVRFLRRDAAATGDETRESVLSQELLAAQIAALLQRWRQRLAGLAGASGAAFLPLEGDDASRRTIRAAYQSFLRAMQQRSLPRPQPATPDEYAAAVERNLPTVTPSLDALTAAYLPARYAADPPAPADAAAATQALAALQAELAAHPPPDTPQ